MIADNQNHIQINRELAAEYTYQFILRRRHIEDEWARRAVTRTSRHILPYRDTEYAVCMRGGGKTAFELCSTHNWVKMWTEIGRRKADSGKPRGKHTVRRSCREVVARTLCVVR